MRHLAVILLVALIGAAVPAVADHAANDECANSLTASNPCLRVTTPPSLPSQVPNKTYYVWVAAYKCVAAYSSACAGLPAEGNPPIGLLGVLYEDTNTLPGLQRASGGGFDADEMLLL